MDEMRLFEGPPDRVQMTLKRTDPVGWTLRIAVHREGNRSWSGDEYESLSLLEATDVVAIVLDQVAGQVADPLSVEGDGAA